jgi:5-methylcytosine-specific restriction endonuclease McrA
LCKEKLIDWEEKLLKINYDNLSDNFQKIDSNFSEISLFKYYSEINSATINPNVNYIFNMNNVSDFNFKAINERITLKHVVTNSQINYTWHKGLDLDHVIPIKLAGNLKPLKILLNTINNLRLVHKNCHKSKTFGQEEQELLKNYRKIRKSFVPEGTKLKTLKQDELQKLHLKTLLELKKNNHFKYLDKIGNKTTRKLFKKFLIETDKLIKSTI